MQKLLLADDDMDNILFFEDAIEELFTSYKLSTVTDGVELMEVLFDNS